MTVPNWLEGLRDLLCKLYNIIDGDCVDFGSTAREQINLVQSAYGPMSPTPGSWEEINATLDELEGHQALSTNPLSSSDDAALTALIQSVRGKVTT